MKHFLFLFLFGIADLARSQSAMSDTTFISIAKKNAIELYTHTANAHSQLYNGREYSEYRQIGEEHPYLYLDWTECTIGYEQRTFEGVPLIYDLSSDEIITEHSSGGKISLIKDRVRFFSMKGHRYEYFHLTEIPEGFYDVLYSGKIKMLAKRSKSRQERISNGTLSAEFDERAKYFLVKDGTPSSFSNKKSLIKLLAADNPEVRKKLEAKKLNFKEKKESSFVQLLELFDQLDTRK